MGFIDDLTVYVWNHLVFIKALAASYGCYTFGGWGLFWDDDDGAMMLYCMELWGGSYVEFPANYVSSYSQG